VTWETSFYLVKCFNRVTVRPKGRRFFAGRPR